MLEVDIYSKILEFMEIVVILKYKKLLQKCWKYANVHGLVVGCELVKQMAEIEKRLSIMTTLQYKVQTMLPGAFGDPLSCAGVFDKNADCCR
jgi:hypothetical protein